mgnify:FL=1
MQSHSGVASTMFEALFNQNINIKMISTSEIKISVIIDEADATRQLPPSTTHSSTDCKVLYRGKWVVPRAHDGARGTLLLG